MTVPGFVFTKARICQHNNGRCVSLLPMFSCQVSFCQTIWVYIFLNLNWDLNHCEWAQVGSCRLTQNSRKTTAAFDFPETQKTSYVQKDRIEPWRFRNHTHALGGWVSEENIAEQDLTLNATCPRGQSPQPSLRPHLVKADQLWTSAQIYCYLHFQVSVEMMNSTQGHSCGWRMFCENRESCVTQRTTFAHGPIWKTNASFKQVIHTFVRGTQNKAHDIPCEILSTMLYESLMCLMNTTTVMSVMYWSNKFNVTPSSPDKKFHSFMFSFTKTGLVAHIALIFVLLVTLNLLETALNVLRTEVWTKKRLPWRTPGGTELELTKKHFTKPLRVSNVLQCSKKVNKKNIQIGLDSKKA